MSFFRKGKENDDGLIKDTSIECNYDCRRKHRHRHGIKHKEGESETPEIRVLSDCPEDCICIISYNPHRMTKEIGLNPGKSIAVFKNEPSDSNMIICVDMTRYIIAKSIAGKITVQIQTESDKNDEPAKKKN